MMSPGAFEEGVELKGNITRDCGCEKLLESEESSITCNLTSNDSVCCETEDVNVWREDVNVWRDGVAAASEEVVVEEKAAAQAREAVAAAKNALVQESFINENGLENAEKNQREAITNLNNAKNQFNELNSRPLNSSKCKDRSISDECTTTYGQCAISNRTGDRKPTDGYWGECDNENSKTKRTIYTLNGNRVNYSDAKSILTTNMEYDINSLDSITLELIDGNLASNLRIMYDSHTLDESNAVGRCELYNTTYTNHNNDWDVVGEVDNSSGGNSSSGNSSSGNFYSSRKLKDMVLGEQDELKYLVKQIYLFDILDEASVLNTGQGGSSDDYDGIYKVIKETGKFTRLRDDINDTTDKRGYSNLLYNVKVEDNSYSTTHKYKTISTCHNICDKEDNCTGYTLTQKPIAYAQSDVDYYHTDDPAFSKTNRRKRLINEDELHPKGAIKLRLLSKTGIAGDSKNINQNNNNNGRVTERGRTLYYN
jgi:hypothetical protein